MGQNNETVNYLYTTKLLVVIKAGSHQSSRVLLLCGALIIACRVAFYIIKLYCFRQFKSAPSRTHTHKHTFNTLSPLYFTNASIILQNILT